MAFIFIPLTILTMESIPKAETGYATSLYSVVRNIGSSVGISFITTWVARRSQFHQSVLVAHVTPYDMQSRGVSGAGKGIPIPPGSRLEHGRGMVVSIFFTVCSSSRRH